MHPQTQYQDLLGSEGPGYVSEVFDEYESHVSYWTPPTDLSCLDPQLAGLATTHTCMNTSYPRPIDSQRFFTATYDPMAHGFSPPPSQHVRPLYQLGGFHSEYEDLDEYRQMRHFSPTDPFGLTLSSTTDSSISDYALSPAFGGSAEGPLARANSEYYMSSFAMPPSSVTGPVWGHQASIMSALPSTPARSDHTALSLRDLQVTPDPELEDEHMEDKDALHQRIHCPEELDLSDQIPSPPDSGLGQSIADDDTIKDEEVDCGALESDADSEFVPAHHPRRRSLPVRHQSLRSPRRPGPTAIIDPKARVHKPAATKGGVILGNNSRSKSKKISPKRAGSLNKCFPCTFHHYGCGATFASKNEWKRHVASQHLQLGYYRCDMGTCSPEVAQRQRKGYNDFNRKDLFTQHCRRMHAPWSGGKEGEAKVSTKEKDKFERQLENIRRRCWIDSREPPPKTKCGFCGEKFEDTKDSRGWEERMEHVGRHYERDAYKSASEDVDEGLRKWAIEQGLVREGKKKGQFWLVGYEPAAQSKSRGSRPRRRSRRVVVKQEVDEDEDEDEEEGIRKEEEDDAVVGLIKLGKMSMSMSMSVTSDEDAEHEVEDPEEAADMDADGETDLDVDADLDLDLDAEGETDVE